MTSEPLGLSPPVHPRYRRCDGVLRHRVRLPGGDLLRNRLPDGRVLLVELAVGPPGCWSARRTRRWRRWPRRPLAAARCYCTSSWRTQTRSTGGPRTQRGGGDPVQEMFWGERYGVVVDPIGHRSSLSTAREQLTPDELARRAPTRTSSHLGWPTGVRPRRTTTVWSGEPVVSAGHAPPSRAPAGGCPPLPLPQLRAADPVACRGRRSGIRLTMGVRRTRPGSCGRSVALTQCAGTTLAARSQPTSTERDPQRSHLQSSNRLTCPSFTIRLNFRSAQGTTGQRPSAAYICTRHNT